MAVPDTSRSTSRLASEFGGLYASALKGLAWFHRWVGVALCLMFAVWFATGAVMVFVAFPSLSEGLRAARSEVVDPTQVRIGPAEASSLLEPSGGVRLISRAGTAAYIGKKDGQFRAISAVDGRPLPPIGAGEARRIAERFGQAPAASVDGPFDYDQWVVHQQFDPLRPVYRVRLADPQKTELYISARTGQVLQQTRGLERAANWVASVTHWIYFVPLRRSFAAWDWTVWVLSLIGLTSVTAGIWLGLTRSTRKMRSKRPALSPFRGLMRWHHVIGLAAGGFVLFWIVSGWLSMDHGRLFSEGEATASAERAYEEGGSGAHAAPLTAADVRTLATTASSITFDRVDGCQVAAATGPATPRIVAACPSGRMIGQGLPRAAILSAIAAAWPLERVESLTAVRADSPYAKAESLPNGVLEAKLTGPRTLRLFIDPVSGKLLVVMDRSREAYAWLYYMVHTYNYPGLSDRPALRITILLVPLALGFTFSITGVLVSLRRLRSFQPAPSRSKSGTLK